MRDEAGHVHSEKMRVLVAQLRKRLWDASRQMDLVRRVFPKDARVARAQKDVSAALHGSYVVFALLRDRGELDGTLHEAGTPAPSQD